MALIINPINNLKPLVLASLYHLRVFDILRCAQKDRVIILMYHRFSDKNEPFKVRKDIFENQIKFIKKRYNFISLEHYSEILNGQRSDCPNNPVIITIDDGYWDNYTYAYPILNKYSVPATIFLTTDFINHKAWLWPNKLQYILKSTKRKSFDFPIDDRAEKFQVDNFKNWHRSQLKIFNYCITISDDAKNEYLNGLSKHLKVDVTGQTVGDFMPLTWEQIKEMSNKDITFGSHTCTHAIQSRLNNEELKHDITESKILIETKLGIEVKCFCYPNGQKEDINENGLNILKEAGYSCAVTTIRGSNNVNGVNPFLLKRTTLSKDDIIVMSKQLTLRS